MFHSFVPRWLKLNICLLLLLYPLQSIAVTEDQFSVHGLSAFKEDQAKMLQSWLSQGVNATRATLGVYPTPLSLHLYPKKSNQPVPWAYTRRNGKGSVHFHVDSRFPLTKFVDDWTIYHELAHMALPYLGPEYRWLSEGFASFMQYQIMVQARVLKGNLNERYASKINPHLRWFNSDLSAASIATRLMDNKQYPAAYWGSAYFFVLADNKLQKQHQISLPQLISLYQDCCRAQDHNVEEVFASLDRMIEGNMFAQLIDEFKNLPARELYPKIFNQ
jgi:hypothetical protein